jgi:hypothetical protein
MHREASYFLPEPYPAPRRAGGERSVGGSLVLELRF